MTTRTTIETSKPSGRALIGMSAATLALLGALLWHVSPASETGTRAATTHSSTINEGAVRLGGLAELYRDQERAQTEREGARGTPRGSLVEQYPEDQRALATAETTPNAATAPTSMGGMAELCRDQAAATDAR
jgi:hypothetical protein